MRELIVAGTGLEQLAAMNALSAAYYAGAVVGSLAVATGRTLSGGTSLPDVLLYSRMNHISTPWLPATLRRYRDSKVGAKKCTPMLRAQDDCKRQTKRHGALLLTGIVCSLLAWAA